MFDKDVRHDVRQGCGPRLGSGLLVYLLSTAGERETSCNCGLCRVVCLCGWTCTGGAVSGAVKIARLDRTRGGDFAARYSSRAADAFDAFDDMDEVRHGA
jgi:hypothetical protein